MISTSLIFSGPVAEHASVFRNMLKIADSPGHMPTTNTTSDLRHGNPNIESICATHTKPINTTSHIPRLRSKRMAKKPNRSHKRCTVRGHRSHKGCAVRGHRSHKGCTVRGHRSHKGCTVRVHRIHKGCTVRGLRSHKGCAVRGHSSHKGAYR